ncbi:hypothetical protein ACFVQ4_35485 [Streptomyces laurentii]|uniref:hypothetical protein n=1 Tax=Streptomyces laurentii TaxID=39478 RepID=UPI0036B3549F
MTSSRLDHSTWSTGGTGGTGGDSRAPGRQPARYGPAERYDAYLDGLFTYCLSVLCDHDTATAVLGDVLALAERHQGRCPADESGRRAWLYALARWTCLRVLGEQRRARRTRRGAGAGAHTGRPSHASVAPAPLTEPPTPEVADRRRAELAALAWPEAAGTTPQQREALELAVRHGLGAREIAAVLSLDPVRARELLSSAACEVERTRAALAVVGTGGCPVVARFTGDQRVLLSATLRTELVRHVDDCPRCRRAAERAGASGPWPGALAAALPGTASAGAPRSGLPIVPAPRAAAYGALRPPTRAWAVGPHFAATGFPVDPKVHAARRDRMRTRALTTTLVAAVVAAPVLALWTSYRGVPGVGEGQGGTRISAREADEPSGGSDARPTARYENTGSARTSPDPRYTRGSRSPDVSVEVISPGEPAGPVAPGTPAPARIAAAARGSGTTTLLTLTNEGGRPGTWSLWSDAPWLYVSRAAGSLAPGESVTVRIAVDRRHEPDGPWSARVGVQPAGAMVRIGGYGTRPAPATTRPAPPRPTGGGPSAPPPTGAPPTSPPPSTAEPTRPPATAPPTSPATTDPAPTPTPTGPAPTPGSPDPDPSPSS